MIKNIRKIVHIIIMACITSGYIYNCVQDHQYPYIGRMSEADRNLLVACHELNSAAVKNMLAAGADVCCRTININTPLHLATDSIVKNSTSSREYEYNKIKKYLIDAGGNMKALNYASVTPQDIIDGKKNIDGDLPNPARSARWW